ncbi:MAG: (2Fe-2S)-binding protein, partial [Erysipelotrichaceae bacterium]|nr:(2Fe-2S)-binding protein [Erysipelotrichaceae bacterium]
MSEVHLKIDNIDVTANAGDTILDAAIAAGIHIPTLCYLKDVNKSGACRVCLVEVKRARTLLSACTTPVAEGQEVFTHSKRVLEARKNTVELILSNHSKDCLSCIRNQNCELQTLTEELGIREVPFSGAKKQKTIDDFVIAIERDASK